MDAVTFSFFPPAVRVRRTPTIPSRLRFSASASATAAESEIKVENRKLELLRAVTDTKRGLTATPLQRSSIEEALVSVESFDAGEPIELSLLDGTWRLQYTSAPDVLILFQSAATLPFFEVDQIYQKFECGDQSREGVVRNIVRWSIPTLLEEHEGATLIVSANFSAVSIRNIYLEFQELLSESSQKLLFKISDLQLQVHPSQLLDYYDFVSDCSKDMTVIAVQNIKISEELQALLAPAILPRSFLSLQILQFIRSFKAQFPVGSSQRRSVGGLYYLSYLDRNMLLGRAVGGGGVFVFTKAQPFIC